MLFFCFFLQKNPEGQIKKVQQQDGQVQQQPSKNGTETKSTVKDKNNMLIRGVTFYKADEDSFKEKEENNQNTGRGKNSKWHRRAFLTISGPILYLLYLPSSCFNPKRLEVANCDQKSITSFKTKQ